MDFMKVGEAIRFFIYSSKLEVIIVRFLEKSIINEKELSLFRDIEDLLIFSERDEKEIKLGKNVVSKILKEEEPTIDELNYLIELIRKCKKDINLYIEEKLHLDAPKTEKMMEYYLAIKQYAEEMEKNKINI